ncbi:MAG: M23 family metallopeptidase [Myxococcota bacterium]
MASLVGTSYRESGPQGDRSDHVGASSLRSLDIERKRRESFVARGVRGLKRMLTARGTMGLTGQLAILPLVTAAACSNGVVSGAPATFAEPLGNRPEEVTPPAPIVGSRDALAVSAPLPGVTTLEPMGAGPSPGQAAVFSLRIDGGSVGFRGVQAMLSGKRAVVWARDVDRRTLILLVPVPIEEKRAVLSLLVTGTLDDGSPFELQRDVPVVPIEYPSSKLRVGRQFLRPGARDRRRAKREQKQVHDLLQRRSPTQTWAGPFQRPTQTPETSPFGTRRVLNGRQKSRHLGWDLDGDVGDLVAATQDGQVVLAAEHFYSGGTVIIDHGQGFFSLYFHLSAIDVAAGDRIPRGHTIGRVGKTGRVTGPHLHFALKIDDVSIDPTALLELPWSELIDAPGAIVEGDNASVGQHR